MSSQWSFTKGWFEQLQIRGCLHVHMPSLAHAWSFLQRWLVVPGFDCLWLCLCMYVQLPLCTAAFPSPQMILCARIGSYVCLLLCVCICLCSDYIVIGTQQGTINCASLLAGLRGSGDPRRKSESERGREKSVAFVCIMIKKNHRNARSAYIASQKAWFAAFIAIIKKFEHML